MSQYTNVAVDDVILKYDHLEYLLKKQPNLISICDLLNWELSTPLFLLIDCFGFANDAFVVSVVA